MLDKNDIQQIGDLMDNRLEKFAVKFLLPSFQQIEDNFLQIDKRFEQVDKRFEKVDKRFEEVDKRFEQIDNRFEQADDRFDRIEESMGRGFQKVNEEIIDVKTEVEKLFKTETQDTLMLDEEVENIKKTLKKHNINVPRLKLVAN